VAVIKVASLLSCSERKPSGFRRGEVELSRLATVHLADKTAEQRVRLSQKLLRRADLAEAALLKNDDEVRVDNRPEPVRNNQQRCARELAADGALDGEIGLDVDVGRRLIKHYELAVAEQCARQAEELPLPAREV